MSISGINMEFGSALSASEKKERFRCVVRLVTSAYTTSTGGAALRKELRLLKRKSEGRGVDFINEEAGNIGDLEFMEKIENLFEVKDGVYELVTCNEVEAMMDGLSLGHIDDYDYKLIPFSEA